MRMRRDRLVVAVAAGLAAVSAAGVAWMLPGAQPAHEAVRLAPRVQESAATQVKQKDERLGQALAEAASPARVAQPAGSVVASTAAADPFPEGHDAGDDPNAKYGWREEEGTLRRFKLAEDPSAALSPFGGVPRKSQTKSQK